MTPKGIGQRKKDGRHLLKRKGKNYLLAIAVDEYQLAPRLYNCVHDAGRLIDVLTQKYQFEPEDTFTLFNADATETGIMELFKKMVSLVRPEDNLLVIYSGHGEYETDIDEGYWIPVDARFGDSSDYISNSRIIKYIKAIQAHHTLFIVDSCFSGSLFASKGQSNPTAVSRLDSIASRWLITAGRNEVVSDGKPGDHSPFADNIIYFLENNTEPSLSITGLIEHVIHAVAYNASQTPRGEPLQDVGHRGGQFFFYLKGFQPTVQAQAVANHPAPQPLQPAQVGFRQKYGARMTLAAAGLILVFALWLFSNQQDRSRTKDPQRTEHWELRLAQMTHDSLLARGQQALQNDQLAEAKGYFQEALQTAAGYAIDTGPTQAALDDCNKRLITQAAAAESAKDQQPSTPGGDKSPKENPPLAKEELAWQKAEMANEKDAYRKYLQVFPEGKYVREAREKIAGFYDYRPLFPFSMGGDKVLKITLRDGIPPYRVRINDPATEKTIEQTFETRGNYEILLSVFQKEGLDTRMISISVMDGNFKMFRTGLPF